MMAWLNSSTTLTALAGLIAIYAAIRSSHEAAKDAEERNRLLEKLDDKNSQLIAAQKETIEHFTGGNSIVYLHFDNFLGDQPVQRLEVLGKHPVPHAVLGVVDIINASKLNIEDPSQKIARKKAITTQRFSLIWPNSDLAMNNFPFPESGLGLFHIHITQPNGRYMQVVKLSRVGDDSNVFAYQLYQVLSTTESQTSLLPLPQVKYIHPLIEQLDNRDEFLREVFDPAIVVPGYVIVENPQGETIVDQLP